MTGARATALALLLAAAARSEARRLVVIKCDGVPQRVVERMAAQEDPLTGRSRLPWIREVFYERGVRFAHFYTRGLTLSAPAWSLIETGQPLRIKGNVEFDRYTLRAYDYLNFFPFYFAQVRSRRADLPGVEVLDQAGLPLLIDRFAPEERFQGFQLFQRGVPWRILSRTLSSGIGASIKRWFDEWQPGLEMGKTLFQQTERELIAALGNPKIRYADLFTGDYDHLAHLDRNPEDQARKLQEIDAMVGRVWTAIESSPLRDETVLVLVSDHGMNTEEKIYSQGYNLIELLNSPAGGAHHVVTNRYPLTEYRLRGFNPFVSEVTNPSKETHYLKDQQERYPTALLDLDGNERASVHLRHSDWNLLHILAAQLARADLPPAVRKAAARASIETVDRHREDWRRTAAEIEEEVAALRRGSRLHTWTSEVRGYAAYAAALRRAVAATAASLENDPVKVEERIPRRALGDLNSAANLRRYVADIAPGGLRLDTAGAIDFETSFRRVDYLGLLASLTVRNSVQEGVGSRPIDYVAVRLPAESAAETAVLLYGGEQRQAKVVGRRRGDGRIELRYAPVSGWRRGLPLELWEDPDFGVPEADRAEWLAGWHDEREWLKASHLAKHANGVAGLYEHFARDAPLQAGGGADGELLARLERRRRRLVETDLLVVAGNHWNFNVRGFNPGGNHGSFRRVSAHAVWMMAGGGLPAGREITEPYDSLSFFPTMLGLMGDKSARQSRYAAVEVACKE